MTTTAVIGKLTIQRLRGLETFDWHAQPGMNVVLGGGDVGKTTVLEANALLPSDAKKCLEDMVKALDAL